MRSLLAQTPSNRERRESDEAEVHGRLEILPWLASLGSFPPGSMVLSGLELSPEVICTE